MNLKGKNVLITQSALHFLAGSEITTLELANYFTEQGANVLVFTWYLADPMSVEFQKNHISVTIDEDDERLDKIDIAWIHHQVIPKRLLFALKNNNLKTRFFFYHMSPLDYVPIEWPYLYQLEQTVADKSLFASPGTKDSIIELFPSLKSKSYVLENLLPNQFLEYKHEPTSLHKVLIVSNHNTPELNEAAKLLDAHSISVEYIGQNKNVKPVSVNLLKKYDLIITIGKTAVYCLGSNIPVYVYDHFGGPGYLSEKNIDKTRYRTFSGRGFPSKKANTIANEIINNYSKAVKYQSSNVDFFKNTFSIDKQLKYILASQPKNSTKTLSDEQLSSFYSIQHLVKDKVVAENTLVDTIKYDNQKISSLEEQLSQSNQLLKNITQSKLYKLLLKIDNISHPFKRQKR